MKILPFVYLILYHGYGFSAQERKSTPLLIMKTERLLIMYMKCFELLKCQILLVLLVYICPHVPHLHILKCSCQFVTQSFSLVECNPVFSQELSH